MRWFSLVFAMEECRAGEAVGVVEFRGLGGVTAGAEGYLAAAVPPQRFFAPGRKRSAGRPALLFSSRTAAVLLSQPMPMPTVVSGCVVVSRPSAPVSLVSGVSRISCQMVGMIAGPMWSWRSVPRGATPYGAPPPEPGLLGVTEQLFPSALWS